MATKTVRDRRARTHRYRLFSLFFLSFTFFPSIYVSYFLFIFHFILCFFFGYVSNFLLNPVFFFLFLSGDSSLLPSLLIYYLFYVSLFFLFILLLFICVSFDHPIPIPFALSIFLSELFLRISAGSKPVTCKKESKVNR